MSEKCHHVLSALSAANTNVGIKELEEAANTVSGILGDLDTTIMFATAGTYNADVNEDNFSGNFLQTVLYNRVFFQKKLWISLAFSCYCRRSHLMF